MTTPIFVILGIAALLAVMYFFGGNDASAAPAGTRRVRFSEQNTCAGDTCHL